MIVPLFLCCRFVTWCWARPKRRSFTSSLAWNRAPWRLSGSSVIRPSCTTATAKTPWPHWAQWTGPRSMVPLWRWGCPNQWGWETGKGPAVASAAKWTWKTMQEKETGRCTGTMRGWRENTSMGVLQQDGRPCPLSWWIPYTPGTAGGEDGGVVGNSFKFSVIMLPKRITLERSVWVKTLFLL